MNILLNGISGHMGNEVVKLCDMKYRGAKLTAGVDINPHNGQKVPVFENFETVENPAEIDCIIDFSHHSAVSDMLEFAKAHKIPTVVATTGHTEEELLMIQNAAEKIPVFFSANMSLGVALLVELAKKAASAMPDAEIEIVETHHNRKLDAPSGTALMLADAITEVRNDASVNPGRCGQGKRKPEEIGIHAIRMGNIVGIHEVIVGTQNQTITLKHEAHSRALFAEGALSAAEFILGKEAGIYDMKSLVSNKSADTAILL